MNLEPLYQRQKEANEAAGKAYREIVAIERQRTVTLADVKAAKLLLEQEIAEKLKEFGNFAQCEVRAVHVRSTMWGADEERPLAYHVEISANL